MTSTAICSVSGTSTTKLNVPDVTPAETGIDMMNAVTLSTIMLAAVRPVSEVQSTDTFWHWTGLVAPEDHVTVGAALATATRLAARRDEAMNMLFGLEVTAGNKGRER